ncbi:MAG TPA: RDD family protein, partial [Verrucomicrobiae bacterium]
RHPAAPATIPTPVMSAAAPPAMPAMSSEPPPPPTPSNTPSAAVPVTIAPPVLPDTLAYPKASFWERMAAGFLDVVLLVILGAIVQGPPLALIVALAYFAGLWAWRGTSIGGIVLGLKVVRAGGEQLSFVAALVRALAAAFSGIVLFLGFFWIAWDPEKQGWHDKIAGTVVLKLPRGTPLVCF